VLVRVRVPVAQIMLGVDRLDMVKGIPQKLLAYEKFLDEHPEWQDKVRLYGGRIRCGCTAVHRSQRYCGCALRR
jgi:hypothetical protein